MTLAVRVVFVDFDGVLNAEAATDEPIGAELWSADWLDADMVARLSDLVARAEASVVISSSWRGRRSSGELAAMLASRGYRGDVVGVTPRLPRPPEGERFVRMAEVEAWLAAHPEVVSFVILDDEHDFGALSANHVRTDPRVGLTDADTAMALAILRGPLHAP